MSEEEEWDYDSVEDIHLPTVSDKKYSDIKKGGSFRKQFGLFLTKEDREKRKHEILTSTLP